MMLALHLRRAEPADCDALFNIRRRAILGLAVPRMNAEDAARWASRLEPSGMVERLSRMEIWVAQADDEIVGWVGIQEGWLENIYRDPDRRWLGVGSALLAHVEQLMRERGIPKIGLKSAASAVGFYQRHGYMPSALPESDGSWRHEKVLAAI